MGLFDEIGDVAGDVAGDVLGAVGAVAKPLAPLLAFGGINTGPTGSTGGFTAANLFSGLRQGIGQVALNNPLGLVDMAKHAWDDQLSPLEKGLGIAGLVMGAGALGRSQYRKHMGKREILGQFPETLASSFPDPASVSAFESVGLPPRLRRPDFNPVDNGLDRYMPGISHRSAMILTAQDALETSDALGRWDRAAPGADVHKASLATIVDSLARRIAPEMVEGGVDPAGLRGAQLDLAKAVSAFDRHIFSDKGQRTEKFRSTLSKALRKPGSLSPGDVEQLTTDLATFGEATQRIGDPDLQFDPIARIVGLSFTEDGSTMLAHVDRPAWGGEVFSQESSGILRNSGRQGYITVGERTRHTRLRQINYQPLHGDGLNNVRELGRIAMSGEVKLELGQGWYTVGRDETHRQHGTDLMPRLAKAYGPMHWKPSQDHALAAVALTSAGETWTTNISKAMDALEVVGREDVGTPEFQNWLRTGKGDTRTHTALFNEIHAELNGRKMKFDGITLKKLLRMREESPETIFQTSGGKFRRTGMKQKNFYLNLKDPSLKGPVTVDRHAYDAYIGMDPGIGNRPLDMQVGEETLYPQIAEAYRQVAEEMDMLPNELQAVVWETIKTLKENHRANVGTWATGDPWRLPAADGGENKVFQALQGQGGISVPELVALVSTERMPVQFGPRRSDGSLELRAAPNGSFVVLGDPSGPTHDALRTLHPEVMDPANNIVRWVPGVTRRVQDLQVVLDDFNGRLPSGNSPGHVLESYDNTSLAGPHPMTIAGHHAIFTMPDGLEPGLRQAIGKHQVRELPGSTIDKPTYGRARHGIADLDEATIDDPRTSQIATAPWVIVNAPPGQLVALARDMRRKGFKPIPVEGTYGGAPEQSLMAFGASPEEGLKWGKAHGQESIVTPDGLFFTDGQTMPSTGGITFDANAERDFSTITLPSGKKVKFSVDIPGEMVDMPGSTLYDTRGAQPGRRFHVELPAKATTEQLAQLARDLKIAGGTDIVAYGHTSNLGPEFTKTRDSLYTDGSRTVVHRSLHQGIDSPNGYPSFVFNEDSVGLPTTAHSLNKRSISDRNLRRDEVSGLAFLNNEVAVASDHLPGVVLKADVFRSTVKGARTTHFTVSNVPGEMPVVTIGRTADEARGMFVGAIEGHMDRRGNPVLVSPAGMTDMAPLFAAADTLRRMGYDPLKITFDVPDGTGDVLHRMQPLEDKTPVMETVFNATGDPIPFERPNPNSRMGENNSPARWLDKDPVAAEAAAVARKLAWELDNETSQMLGIHNMDLVDAHPETAKVYRDAFISLDNRFPGIWQEYNPQHIRVVDPSKMSKSSAIAEMNFTGRAMKGTPGIQFNGEWAKLSPDEARTAYAERVPKGFWAPTDLSPHLATVAHEFMHMIHAVMHNRDTHAGNEFQRWMMKRFEYNGNGPGNAEIGRGVSRYAADMWMEGVAEALLEYHFNPKPRPLAIEIANRFREAFDYKGPNILPSTHFQPGGKRAPVQGPPAPVMTDAQKMAQFNENVRIAKKKGLNHPSTDLGGRMVDS